MAGIQFLAVFIAGVLVGIGLTWLYLAAGDRLEPRAKEVLHETQPDLILPLAGAGAAAAFLLAGITMAWEEKQILLNMARFGPAEYYLDLALAVAVFLGACYALGRISLRLAILPPLALVIALALWLYPMV